MPPSHLPSLLADKPLDHLGIVVVDLEEGSQPYRLLGLEQEGDDEEVSGQHIRVRAFRAGDSLLELLAPTANTGPIARFLKRRGPGLHHLALRVETLEDEIERLTRAGADFIDPLPRPGRGRSRVVFLHPRWAGGVLLELVDYPNL